MAGNTKNVQHLGNALYHVFVAFPVNALTTPRQEDLSATATTPSAREDDAIAGSKYKVNDRLYQWCQSKESVSSLLAADPTVAPGEAWEKLFGRHEKGPGGDIRDVGKGPASHEELRRTRFCGSWGLDEPSDLFLRLYHDALCTLDDSPSRGMVSPSLMGCSGKVPLTIISVIPDIVRHMSNLIVRAEKEVFLATNFWQNGVAARFITDAVRELSRRAGERGARVVVRIIYDRGSPRQLLEPHYVVAEGEFTGRAVGLPARREIPNVDLQVMNYHHPMLGTFHSKYMVVDRRFGVVQSNNIQDNDNLEMMVQFEGAVVDSLYDMALLSWHKKMETALPCLGSPAASAGGGNPVGDGGAGVITPEGTIKGHSAVVDPRRLPKRPAYGIEAAAQLRPQPGAGIRLNARQNGPDGAGDTVADHKKGHVKHDSVMSAHASEYGRFKETVDDGSRSDATRVVPPAQTDDASSAVNNYLPEHTTDDPHYDTDLAGEVLRVQTAVSSKAGETQMQAVTRHLNHTTNSGFQGDVPECDPVDEMTPYIPHPTHDAFPMALVCRPPYGPPNHKSVSCPQNAAWLSALRNAQKNVFIQTPTLNAQPLLPAIREACERGVDVYCYVCLGYNDAGELLPMQGGHNDMVAHSLYASLSSPGKQHLHWHWYVAKDQTRPVVAEKKRRSCHIKLMIVDEHVGIAGNGNQDTQSWFHSQEVNVMVDSADVCRAWIEALRRNQNTHAFGEVGREDGVWRDGRGERVRDAMGVDPGRFPWAKGVVGAVKRVQGTGGF